MKTASRIPGTSLRLSVALACVLLSGARAASPAGAAATDEDRISELEAAWNAAHLAGDVQTLDRLWAPDMTVIVPGMRPLGKPELLAMWRATKVRFTAYTTSEVTLRIHGDTAVVTGRLQRTRDFSGRVATEDWLFTKTYARVAGEWRVMAYHASERPPA